MNISSYQRSKYIRLETDAFVEASREQARKDYEVIYKDLLRQREEYEKAKIEGKVDYGQAQ